MADLTQTASAVLLTSGQSTQGTLAAGVTATQGQPLYINTDNLLALSDANVTAAENIIGVALSAGSPGQKITYAVEGATVNLGITLTAGSVVYISPNVGRLTVTDADIVSNCKRLILGAANADGTLTIRPIIGSLVP